MKSEQWKWVDIAKGIGIILVFLGHFNIPDTLRAEIYTFHMPLFFFLSVSLMCFGIRWSALFLMAINR